MIIRLHVKTPPGHAESVEKKLRHFLLGKLKGKASTYLHPKGEEFYWELDVNIKKYFKIQRNAQIFQTLAGGTLDQIEKKTWLKKMAKVTNDTINGARKLIDETKVEIIKQANAKELIEYNTTLWDKIKETFKKKKIN